MLSTIGAVSLGVCWLVCKFVLEFWLMLTTVGFHVFRRLKAGQ
jgi:hypothetical protein